jgi:hypothetical protein
MLVLLRAGALAAFMALAACGGVISEMYGVPIVDPEDALDVTSNTSVEYDTHEGRFTVQGPLIYAEKNIFGHSYLLRAWPGSRQFDPADPAQLYVRAAFEDWTFLDRAYSQGESLHVSKISRDVGTCSSYGCRVKETVGINLTIAKLEAIARRQVFSVKIAGRKGSIVIDVPTAYIRGFLARYRDR